MTSFLSTGESEYCECGHHIEEHDEDSPSNGNIGFSISANYVQCLSLVSEPGSKCKCSFCLSRCKCNQFTPYQRLKAYSFEF